MFNLKDWSSVIRRCINGIIYPITSQIVYTICTNSTEKIFRQEMNCRCSSRYCNKIPHVGPPLVVAALATFPAILSVTGPPLKPASIHEVEVQSFLYSFSWLVFLKIRLTKHMADILKKIQSTLNKIQIPTIFVNVVEKKHI
ncbi:Uncharacterised protein [Neisseria gonorrhoeae]|uniref:Uncharacterized protein n=1 Tax=Neisseria gonorrhoeae TaxID=485 RepID=A0A378W177_NEIGO|nr:Uncharacterised protein [Neisseria gonorrhoeae]